jgi:predicted membrane-bound dolichyl-phosphate-mannose-protein mannosyltransferase
MQDCQYPPQRRWLIVVMPAVVMPVLVMPVLVMIVVVMPVVVMIGDGWGDQRRARLDHHASKRLCLIGQFERFP